MRLVIFDVDGTLIDSQAEIMAAMGSAFQSEGLTLPERAVVLSIVGLSLAEAVKRLSPTSDQGQHGRLVDAYKDAFAGLRTQNREMGPLFPGAREAIDRLLARDDTLLAIATGKSRRGLDKVLERHGLTGVFHSEQVADHHPSKPHPSMILTALRDTGVTPDRAVMVGDTTYDMDMANAAGIRKIGVPWGYHPADQLKADAMIDTFTALEAAVDRLLDG